MRRPTLIRALSGLVLLALAGCGDSPAASPNAASSAAAPTSAAATTAAPTSAAPTTAAATTAPASAMTVAAPKTLLGLAPATESSVKQFAGKLAGGFEAPAGATLVSGAYGSTGRKNVVAFVAIASSHPDGNEALAAVEKSAFAQYTFHPVDTGALSGAAGCADATSGSVPASLCLWADTQSFGVVYLMYSSAAQADTLLGKARGEIEVPRK